VSASLAWITGAGGLIGHHLLRVAPQAAPGWRVAGLTRAELDLTDTAALRARFQQERPSLVIHCAALSRAAACEADPALARRVNIEATALLAELAQDIPIVFFSTDLVFDGAKGGYVETDAVNPLNLYAATKGEAEPLVLRHPRALVLRTSLNGGASPTGDRGFNEEMRRALAQGKELSLFTDEFRCPIAAVVTARAAWELALRGATGLLHLAGSERLSRWEIGRLLGERWPALPGRMTPGSLKDFKGPRRAPDTSLDCARAQALLTFPLPRFSQWLRENPAEPF
jgi:dTDP-4-dehydrorhamnose reductase